MLSEELFTPEYIRKIQNETKSDPALIERVVFSFGMLEALSRSGLPFIFKGGTALLLLLPVPCRFSTDIDILVEPGTEIEEYIDRASKIFPFKRYEEISRSSPKTIQKRHFRFYYTSPSTGKEFANLLDVVFARNPYSDIRNLPVDTSLFPATEPMLHVDVPSVNAILADKLTAFAPHTTGIPFGQDKELEIIKQFYDIARLIDAMDDYPAVRDTYDEVVREELAYCTRAYTRDDVLWDTIRACVCIAGRGIVDKTEYARYLDGIRRIRNHIIHGRYSAEHALRDTGKVAYLASCILTGQEYQRIEEPESFLNHPLQGELFEKISYIRKLDPECYAYFVKTSANMKRYIP
ncbi:MAG TPA: nucleotidyl transferase AbiEii/AbiGii toxin family protein [Methanocorpusculum sp.]|nr:nucleotidyl transferase AbiEii/AbiGii toxin family protein [Methanocorpusculum sp.]